MPPPNLKLSVTRHNGLSEEEIWKIGDLVGAQSERALRARSDVMASAFYSQSLVVDIEPAEGNPNHANVIGWPEDLEIQKAKALEIARVAMLLFPPSA